MATPKYQELPEDDERGGLLDQTDAVHSRPGRTPFSKYLYSVILGISLSFNLYGLLNMIQGFKDICIPNPIFCQLSPPTGFWVIQGEDHPI